MSGTAWTIIIVVVVVVAIALLAAFLVSRRQAERQQSARQEYGSEYERMVEERGSEEEAEKELRERRERVEGEIQPLSEESQRRYEERWRGVEQSFVDDPGGALDEADRVVADILVERNFPADTRQEASEGVGVVYPGVVEDFREAQRTYEEAGRSGGEGDLEQMRRAIQGYRSVYERLMER